MKKQQVNTKETERAKKKALESLYKLQPILTKVVAQIESERLTCLDASEFNSLMHRARATVAEYYEMIDEEERPAVISFSLPQR